jgi:hypothetical protein
MLLSLEICKELFKILFASSILKLEMIFVQADKVLATQSRPAAGP